jgi:hypothetical protein
VCGEKDPTAHVGTFTKLDRIPFAEDRAQTPPTVAPAAASMSFGESVIRGLVGLVVLIFIINMIWPEEAARAEHSDIAAATACESFVRDRLRAPSTAKFPWSEQQTVHAGNGLYTVRGAVDAQNGFGAQIRSRYLCRVQFEAADRSWTLKDLTMS